MIAKSKLYSQLDSLEFELRRRIIPHLQNAADGKNDNVFCVSEFNPIRNLKNNTDKITEELTMLGRQVLTLKKKLGESANDTVAERICWYCRKWGETIDPNGKNAQELAKQFLEEIKNRK